MSVKIRPLVQVIIERDRDLVLAFFAFLREAEIYSASRAGGSCGPDFYNQFHDPDDMPRIEKFFKDYKKAKKKA